MEFKSAASAEGITNGIGRLNIVENNAQSPVPMLQFGAISVDQIAPRGQSSFINANALHGKQAVFQPKAYGTVSAATVDAPKKTVNNAAQSAALSNLFKNNLLENFSVDDSTYTTAKIRATFYPKFENEKSDQEVTTIVHSIKVIMLNSFIQFMTLSFGVDKIFVFCLILG